MINLDVAKGIVSKSLLRTGLILRKNGPEIMLGFGVAGVAVGTVLACRATLKAENILVEARDMLDKIDQVRNMPEVENYSDEDAKKDTAIVYVQTGVKLLKEYAPAVLVTAVSIGLILQSHNLLSRRNAALVAAYKLVDASFREYRKRVVEEYGEETDQKLRFGQREIEVSSVDDKGRKKKKTIKILGTNDISPYAFVFSEETSTMFKRNYDMNLNVLRSVQRFSNDRLSWRGHLFLNEVLDDLGMPRTSAGAIVGWVYGHNEHNDNNDQVVIFDIESPVNEEKQDAMESMTQPFYLNFNVDGPIYDQI
jgi:hypothetical protein